MAVARQLPNGMLVLILTPREAVALSDELLDPSKFPWQSSETEMIALDCKMKLLALSAIEVDVRLEQVLSMVPPPHAGGPEEDDEPGD